MDQYFSTFTTDRKKHFEDDHEANEPGNHAAERGYSDQNQPEGIGAWRIS